MRCRSGRGEVGVIFKKVFFLGPGGGGKEEAEAGEQKRSGAGARCTRRAQQQLLPCTAAARDTAARLP